MEKLLHSGGGFGGGVGKKDLRDTFKKIRGELAQEEADVQSLPDEDSAEKSGEALDSDLDLPLNENSKLLMESPGQNTFVMNQINELTGMDSAEKQVAVGGGAPADSAD